jgi:hypothetical protein
MENNEKKRFGRRAGGTAIWGFLVMEIWHIVVFKNLGIEFFETPVRYLTLGLLIVVAGLTATDIIPMLFKKK